MALALTNGQTAVLTSDNTSWTKKKALAPTPTLTAESTEVTGLPANNMETVNSSASLASQEKGHGKMVKG